MTEASDDRPGRPPLRDVIRRHGLGARKGLGQHFLLDLNLTARIVRSAGDLSGVSVLEVGPGPGGLTRALIDSPARAVIAVERDSRCIAALEELRTRPDDADRLTIIEGDALDLDLTTLAPPPRAIIANLPYNVATPLLIGWLRQISDYRSLTLMFQAEVADRLVANPGDKHYGRLSILSQWLCRVTLVMRLPARAFTPPPKVDSAVVHMVPRDRGDDPVRIETMERLTRAAFGQRRKMLRASLKALGRPVDPLLGAAGIDPTRRAETLSLEEIHRLAIGLQQAEDGQATL